MTYVSPWMLNLAAVLIAYTVYSSAILLAVLAVTRWQSRMTPNLRCALWKGALIVPFVLTVLSAIVPGPAWLPQFHLKGAVHHADLGDSSLSSTHDQRGIGFAVSGDRPHRAGELASNTVASVESAADGDSLLRKRPQAAGQPSWLTGVWSTLGLVWLAGAVLGLVRLLVEVQRIRQLKLNSSPLTSHLVQRRFHALQRRAGVPGHVDLLLSNQIEGPLAGGFGRPFIILPCDLFQSLSSERQDAMLAHELGHVARGDLKWNLISLSICRIGFFQPLNIIARRQLRRESEFLADRWAARLLGDPVQLAWCLAELGDWMAHSSRPAWRGQPLAVGMGSLSSDLGRRVAALLEKESAVEGRVVNGRWVAVLGLAFSVLVLFSIPRVSADNSLSTDSKNRSEQMRSIVSTLTVLSGLAFAPAVDAQENATRKPATEAAAAPIAVPRELQQFNGMLIGRMVSRDVERGEFTVTVDHVARVWENNKAEQPRSAVGKTLAVEGVTGKWLDQLLVIRPGETIEFEAQHRGGDKLRFPGEWLRKAPPFDPAAYPIPPDGFRGFAGVIAGKIEAKHEESGELVIQVDQIERTFERNRAENLESVIGKKIILGGFWGGMRKPFEPLKVGDSVRAGVVHRVRQSDLFSVAELIEKRAETDRAPARDREAPRDREAARDRDEAGFPGGMEGFRGILRGTVISRDVETGELVFRALRATRVWKQNKATNVESCEGKVFTTRGITGRFLDVLVTLKPGDLIEVEAFHNRGDHLDFVGELLRKVD
jgi:Zn-dependent protease with chaperone function